jgi:glycosyltransferase involved in cell wall biosynthesis
MKGVGTFNGQKPRVLMITARADHGGGPEHLYQLSMQLSETHTISIASPNDEPYATRFSSIRSLHKQMRIPHRTISLLSFIRLIRFIHAEDIDVIHSHGKGAGLYCRLLAFCTRRFSVHTFHGLHVGEYRTIKKSIYRLVEQLLWRLSDHVIAVSEGEATEILQFLSVSRQKLTIIPNGVVIPDESPMEEPSSMLKVISVSRYDVQKNPLALIEIARGVKAAKANIKIVVIGEGALFEDTQRVIIEEHLSEVIQLAGATKHPRKEMRKAEVALSTSRWEGMPLALLEAMSEGLAIVASDVVGNNDIVTHGKQGYLFPVEDTEQAVQQLIALAKDRKQLAKLAENARQDARQNYSVKTMAVKVEQVYRKLCEQTPSK